jgi:hypothetical protein
MTPAMSVEIRPVEDAADRKVFVDLAFALNADDPNWVPPLKTEVHGLIDPRTNPWFDHAEARLFLAERDGRAVGRISAQVDGLVLEHMGAGTGQWGMFEAADAEVAAALLHRAESWLKGRDMTRSLGPFSLSIWDEPGLLVMGHDHPPTVMMGHNKAVYEAWVEAAGYVKAKDLYTYDLDVRAGFPPLIDRIVASGERNPRIRLRRVDLKRYDEEAEIILHLINDAWSGNWGYTPLTEAEKTYGGKKLKPMIYDDLVRVAELDGEPVAFMMAVPNMNELIRDFDGRLFPFNWAKLLWRLRKPQVETMRVPLMGVARRLQASRLASQIAFMMIEYIRRDGVRSYDAARVEIGWVLEDNEGMVAIADAIGSRKNRTYRIYEKPL